tara:strand:+ start:189 stop:575 length:387 start_codon:yes stop_codon:yes gene_type:complete
MPLSHQVGHRWDFLLNGYCGDARKLDDADAIRAVLSQMALELRMTIVNGPTVVSYKDLSGDPEAGLSAVVIIAEGHIAIHTSPLEHYFAIQVSSCKLFEPVDARRIVTGRLLADKIVRDQFIAWEEVA